MIHANLATSVVQFRCALKDTYCVQSRGVKIQASRATIQLLTHQVDNSFTWAPLASVKTVFCLGRQNTQPDRDPKGLGVNILDVESVSKQKS